MIIVSRENLDQYWSKIHPGLNRTLEETSLGDTWTFQGLVHEITNFVSYVLYAEETGYSVAFTIQNLPNTRIIYCFWSGQDPAHKEPVDHLETMAYLEHAARTFNCSAIHVEGRKGWEKVGVPMGYREDSRVYVKKVHYELPEIQPVAPVGGEPSDG